MKLAFLLCVTAACFGSVLAHGPETPEEVAEFQTLQGSIGHCAQEIHEFEEQRKRAHLAQLAGGSDALMDARAIDGPSSCAEKKDHELAKRHFPKTFIKNSTCVLAPKVTEGPYYHQVGHPIRSNLAEWQLGLLFMMNIGVIDVRTCKPVPNVLVDIWHANATGFYSGHETVPDYLRDNPTQLYYPNGSVPLAPRSDYTETWLRGALPTDKHGVSAFTTVFPGYYSFRATHIHVRVHPEWNPLSNGTFTSGRLVHTGQLFIDDKLNLAIDKLHPYTQNPLALAGVPRARNAADGFGTFKDSSGNGYSPIMDVEHLGGVLSQGLIGYATLGVNMSANYPQVEFMLPKK